MAARPIVTLTTDFGLNDHFVGTVKGVILNIAPETDIVDICHAVQPFDVLDGALTLSAAYSHFPADTVHMVVVDPGVGTARRPIAARAGRYGFIAPDNGVLSLVYSREESVRVYHITAEHYFLQPVSTTFHARDIFAPAAAYLAKGVEVEKFGDEITDFVRLDLPQPKVLDPQTLRGTVLKVDRFGNLITNLTTQHVSLLLQPQPPPFSIVIGDRKISVIKASYGAAAPGELFGIFGSMGYLEIATNQGSAAQTLGVGRAADVDIILGAAVSVGP